MKNFYAVISLLFFTLTRLYAQNYELDYISAGFYGGAAKNGVALLYDEYGKITRTSDKGKTWNIIETLPKDLVVYKLKYQNDNFYALAFSNKSYLGFCLRSIDGLSWEIFELNNRSSRDFLIIDNNIYISQDSSGYDEAFYVYNQNFDLLRIISLDGYILKDLGIFDNKILFSNSKGKIFSYDIQNFILDSVDISYLGKKASNFFSTGKELFAKIDTNIYKTSDLLNWFIIMKGASTYNLYNGVIYEVKIRPVYDQGYKKIYFSKIIEGSIVLINNPDETSILEDSFKNIIFIDDSHILLIGFNRSIAISEDSGANWKLLSNLHKFGTPAGPIVKLDDNSLIINTGKEFFRTDDNGFSWYSLIDKDFYNLYYKNILEFTTNYYNPLKGEGIFISATNGILRDTNFNVAITKDFGKSFKFYWVNSFSFDYTSKSDIYDLDSAYLFISGHSKSNTLLTRFLNKANLSTSYINTSGLTPYLTHLENNILTGIASTVYVDSNQINIKDYYFIKSTDFGTTWNKEKLIVTSLDLKTSTSTAKSSDKFFFTFKESDKKQLIYSVDINSGDYKIIDVIDDSLKNVLFIYNDQLLLYDANNYYTLIENESKRRISPWSTNKIIQSILHINDSLSYAVVGAFQGYDILRIINNKNNVYTEEVPFQTGLSYPNPAHNFVNADFYFSKIEEVNNLKLDIVDIGLNQISYGNNVQIELKSDKELKLFWKTSNISSGTYFIILTNGTERKISKVIIKK